MSSYVYKLKLMQRDKPYLGDNTLKEKNFTSMRRAKGYASENSPQTTLDWQNRGGLIQANKDDFHYWTIKKEPLNG